MADPIPIPDDDDDLLAQCRVETFRGGGPGGQHGDTTDSAVRLVHEPSGTRVVARDERSQHRNKQIALERLRERLQDINEKRTRRPRKKRRVSARQKRKRVEKKRRRGRQKKLRKPPKRDDW